MFAPITLVYRHNHPASGQGGKILGTVNLSAEAHASVLKKLNVDRIFQASMDDKGTITFDTQSYRKLS